MATSTSSKIICKICGSGRSKLFYQDVKGYGTPRNFDLRQCRQCHITFTYPYLSNKEIKDYYDSQKVAFSGQGNNDLVGSYQANKEQYWSDLKFPTRLDEILKMSPHAKTILDVGCGAGFFLDYCRSRGLDTYGLELSNWGQRVASQDLKLKVYQKTLATVNPKLFPKLDAITMYDVLEHSDDPQRDLKICLNLLKKGGILVINLPNIDSFLSRISGKHWNKLIPPNHTFFFNADTLTKLVEAIGFKIETVFTDNGASYELVGEALTSLWRLPGKLFPALEEAYSWKDKPYREHPSKLSAAVKLSRRMFSIFSPLATLLKPVLAKSGKGEVLHLIATK